MDGFHLSLHKYICGYYKSNPIYKANKCYDAVQKPRKKQNKQKPPQKPGADIHKNAEQQN